MLLPVTNVGFPDENEKKNKVSEDERKKERKRGINK
jgi:hypothetical protein